MKKKNSFQDNRSGMTLMIVMVMTLLCTAAVASVLYTVGVRMQRAYKQVDFEKAFYIAEAGLEHVAAMVAGEKEMSIPKEKEGDELKAENANYEQTFPYHEEIGDNGGEFWAKITHRRLFGNEREFIIKSIGKYNGSTCKVAMYGVRGVSWARYALWYNKADPSNLVFARGESFKGRVYSTPQMIFYNNSGDETVFYDRVWTAAETILKYTGANPDFKKNIVKGAEKQEIAEVDLIELRDVANELGRPKAYVFEGTTTIALNGTKMRVTNAKEGWNKKEMDIPESGLIYVKTDPKTPTYTETYYYYDNRGKEKNSTRQVPNGDIFLSAPNGLDGQLTLVAEENINITDHVKYRNDPMQEGSNSDDKLGLIAKKKVTVKTRTPNNLKVYAHIFCQQGGFGVEDYSARPNQGIITVYGGIAGEIRYAVGVVGGGGYSKNYIYDERFARDPPPHYPRQPEELEWERWEDRWDE